MATQHKLLERILNLKLNAYILLYLSLMAVMFGFDGVLKVLKPNYTETGSFNFFIGFLILSLHSFLYLKSYYLNFSNPIKPQEIYSIAFGLVLSVILLGYSLGYFELGKIIRDIFYSFYFIVIFYVIYYFKKTEKLKFNTILKLSFFIYFVIFNFLAVVLGNFDHEDRFTGMQLAASIYGGTACLMLITLLESDLGKFNKVFYFSIGVTFLLLSGTRGAVLSLIVYFAFSLYRTFGKNKVLQTIILMLVLSIVGIIVLKIDQITAAMSALSSLRFASTADLEGGSLGTRLTWYMMILVDLYDRSLIGGFGGGAAEKLTGHITHFDLLRFWYDYSIFFIVVQLMLFIYMIKAISPNWLLIFLYLFAQYLLFSLHNIFQAPTMLLTFALSLVVLASKNKNKYE